MKRSPERPSLIERLHERADKLACSVEECSTSTGYPQPPEPEDDTHEYCLACATNAVSLLLLREAANALESALHRAEQAEQERDRLKELAAAAYQMAGNMDAPVRFLDSLAAAANGEPFDVDGLLPVTEAERGAKLTEAEASISETCRNCGCHLLS